MKNMPYSERDLAPLRERIRRQTTARHPKFGRKGWVVGAIAAAAAGVIGLVLVLRDEAPTPVPDVNQLLSSAPVETVRQAAAENYDDILYNQQL